MDQRIQLRARGPYSLDSGRGCGHGLRPADRQTVREQLARILSLDVDGTRFAAIGERDPVIGRLQSRHPGLSRFAPLALRGRRRALIGLRVRIAQAGWLKQRMAAELGHEVDIHGDRQFAFPSPARLHRLERVRGLTARKAGYLRALAQAAREGVLDAGALPGAAGGPGARPA